MLNKMTNKLMITCVIFITCIPQEAFAYIGPGTGISAIGSVLALLAGIIVAFLGILWYPIKRLFGKKKSKEPYQGKNK